LDIAPEGLKLVKVKPKEEYSGKQLKELLALLVELNKLKVILEKKGVHFKEFLGFRQPKTKKLPIYKAKVDEETHFVYSDSELSKLTGKGKKGKEAEENIELIELFEVEDMEPIINKLEKAGLEMDTYYPVEPQTQTKKEIKKQPVYIVKGEKETIECFSLAEVLDVVYSESKKGMYVQRYKGLGEMNPQQLWETTMDPEKRTVLQVKLEDAVDAEETFSTLMGEEVEARREFIEKQSHLVRNLDI
jgi:DNA gyrase subunit B